MKNIELKTLGIREMDENEMKAYSGGFAGAGAGAIAVVVFGIRIIALTIAIWRI